MVRNLPEPHIRLMFGVMIYRAGLISERGLQRESIAAFGDVGTEIVSMILRGARPFHHSDIGVPFHDGL